MKPMKMPWLLFLLTFTIQLAAQESPKLSLKIEENKVNLTPAEKGKKVPIKITRGDTIRYVITAENVGTGVMNEPVITDPIPAGVRYIPNSAKGEDCRIVFSIDGGKTYSLWPVYYTARDAQGNEVTKMATPDMVTHIRWEIQKPLPVKAKKQVEFKVIVK